MDFFKLFYNHDQRLDNLTPSKNDDKVDEEALLQDFLSPTATFSRFYLTGTLLKEERFGLNLLEKFDQILKGIDIVFEESSFHSSCNDCSQFSEAIKTLPVGSAIIISAKGEGDIKFDPEEVTADHSMNAGHRNEKLCDLLSDDYQVMFKEEARDGYDLHLYSKQNIYSRLFHNLQKLVDDSFRFFSINSKRMHSERHFYFETWRLDRPPHGAEEVFDDTILRSKG